MSIIFYNLYNINIRERQYNIGNHFIVPIVCHVSAYFSKIN